VRAATQEAERSDGNDRTRNVAADCDPRFQRFATSVAQKRSLGSRCGLIVLPPRWRTISRLRTTLDSEGAIDHVATMTELVSSSIARPRLYASLLGIFAAAALLLATVGIYGVTACSGAADARNWRGCRRYRPSRVVCNGAAYDRGSRVSRYSLRRRVSSF
jgi:hypothetical protein